MGELLPKLNSLLVVKTIGFVEELKRTFLKFMEFDKTLPINVKLRGELQEIDPIVIAIQIRAVFDETKIFDENSAENT